jgi:hypothetical protein
VARRQRLGALQPGVILWNAGKFAEAKEKFEAATKADPNNADAQYPARHGQREPGRHAGRGERVRGY